MRLKYFLTKSHEQLRNNIERNLHEYCKEDPWVESCFDEKFDTETKIDVPFCELVNSPEPSNDLDNVKILYSALKSLTTEQAMDGRLWAHFAHIEYWKYMHARWKVDREDITEGDNGPENQNDNLVHRIIHRIRDRYFLASDDNSRPLIRNGIARLWWFGYLTYENDAEDHFALTKTLLDYQDIQAALLERSFGKNNDILRICLRVLADYMQEIRANGGRAIIQDLGKYVNLLGGTYFLDTMDKTVLKDKIVAFIEGKLQM